MGGLSYSRNQLTVFRRQYPRAVPLVVRIVSATAWQVYVFGIAFYVALLFSSRREMFNDGQTRALLAPNGLPTLEKLKI